MTVLAQGAAICGNDEELASNWLCELVFDRTGNQLLARVSGSGPR